MIEKTGIDYPCRWPYKVIGSDQALIEENISAELNHIQFDMAISNHSKNGKYVSFHVEVSVSSDEERMDIFNILTNIATVKIVF